MKGLQSKQVTMYKYIFEKQKLKLLLSNKLKFKSGGPESGPTSNEANDKNKELNTRFNSNAFKAQLALRKDVTNLDLKKLISVLKDFKQKTEKDFPWATNTSQMLEKNIKNFLEGNPPISTFRSVYAIKTLLNATKESFQKDLQNAPESASQKSLEVSKEINNTQKEIQKIKTSIKFSNRKENLNLSPDFKNGTIIKVSKKENLRTLQNNDLAIKESLNKNTELILTGETLTLINDKNNQSRTYLEVVTANGETAYIIGESVQVSKTIENNDKANIENNKNLTAQQQQYLKKLLPSLETKQTVTTETKVETKPESAASVKLENTEIKQESPNEKYLKLQKEIVKYKATRLKTDKFQNPNYLRNLLKNDQVVDSDRTKIENAMNNLNISFAELSEMIDSNLNTLPLSKLIQAKPLPNEDEFEEAKKEFYLSPEGGKLNKEIEQLKKSKKQSDKIKLIQKQDEFAQKQESYGLKRYSGLLEIDIKNPAYKSVLVGYLKRTQKLSESKNPKDQEQFQARYEKLQSIYELASTLQNLKPNATIDIDRDQVEDLDASYMKEKVIGYSGFLSPNLQKKVTQNLENGLFDKKEKKLLLLATIQLSTNKTLPELLNSDAISKEKGKLKINPDKFSKIEMEKICIGVAYSPDISKSLIDNLLDKDNLTEVIYKLQTSKQFDKAKLSMYQYELNQNPKNAGYIHLNQVFDKNYYGNVSKQNDRLYTRTMEDSLGNQSISVTSESVLRRYSSDLAQYQLVLQEVEENGLINEEKLLNKFNQLIQLGGLGVDLNEQLPYKQKNHLKEKSTGKLTAEELRSGLTPSQISLIRHGAVYEQLRDDFLKTSKNSPNKKMQQMGIPESKINSAYSAISTALQYINSGNIAIAGASNGKDLGDGWKLRSEAGGGVYFLENPQVTLAGGLEIQKVDKDSTFQVSLTGGVGLGPKTLGAGVNLETGGTAKINESLTFELAVGGGLTVGGINIYGRFGLSENNIAQDQELRFTKGLENMRANQKLTKEQITYLKNLSNSQELKAKDIEAVSKLFPIIDEAIQKDPKLQSLPQAQKDAFREGYIKTILQSIHNMSVEQAEGINWSVAITPGLLITPIGTIPYIMLGGGLEWGGETQIMKMYNTSSQKIDEATMRTYLKNNIKKTPNKELKIEANGVYAMTSKDGKEIVVTGTDKAIQNIEISDPLAKLNSLRSNTGLEFQPAAANYPNFYNVKIDDFSTVREGINSANATRVNVYIDPAIKNEVSLRPKSSTGEFSLLFQNDNLPENLVILRETITTPSTSGGTTTEVKISFTTKENAHTGSEIENSSNLASYVSFNKFGKPEFNNIENNLNFDSLKKNNKFTYNENFTTREVRDLGLHSKYLLNRSKAKFESGTYRPSQKINTLINKLAENPKVMQELAKVTIENIQNGKSVDAKAASEIIQKSGAANELNLSNLSKEDYLYIYGNLMPNTYRAINALKPEDREKAINDIAESYVTEYVTSLCKYRLKPNGKAFTSAEQKIIISHLSRHSMVKENFRQSLLTPEVTLENVGGPTNKENLNGFQMYTTAHKGNIKGLRNSQITNVSETEIVRSSLTKLDKSTVPSDSDRELINEFLLSLEDPMPDFNSNEITQESIVKNKEIGKKIFEVLNSRTALMLMAVTPYKANGEPVSLFGAIYGPEDLIIIEEFYSKMDQYGKFPIGIIGNTKNPNAERVLKRLIDDVQKVHQSHNTVTLKDYKGKDIQVNVKQEAGVVLIGKCANPTYLHKRNLTAKLSYKENNPAAAKASTSTRYEQGQAKRSNMQGFNIGTKVDLSAPKVPTPEPKKPNIPREPNTPDTPPDTPPGTPKIPGKTNTTSAPRTSTSDVPDF